MFTRRSYPRFLLLSALMLAAGPLAAQNQESSDKPVATIKDTLEKGLRARRPVEFQFVARVAELVEDKQLTKEFVLGTYQYTVRRYGKRKYLVTYFEQILRQRAAKEKITVLNNVPTTIPKITTS